MTANKFLALAAIALCCAQISFAQTWTPTSAPFMTWYGIASSADGNKIAAIDYSGRGVWISSDAGLTWGSNSLSTSGWTCIACSVDGSKLAACKAYSAIGPNLYLHKFRQHLVHECSGHELGIGRAFCRRNEDAGDYHGRQRLQFLSLDIHQFGRELDFKYHSICIGVAGCLPLGRAYS